MGTPTDGKIGGRLDTRRDTFHGNPTQAKHHLEEGRDETVDRGRQPGDAMIEEANADRSRPAQSR